MNYSELNFDSMTRERELSMSAAFPALMRKVYVWMTLALVLTGVTAYGVATSPGVITAIYSNQILFWGLVIAEFALVIGITAAINKLSLTTATLMFVLLDILNLHDVEYRQRVLYHGGYLCSDGIHRIYHED